MEIGCKRLRNGFDEMFEVQKHCWSETNAVLPFVRGADEGVIV